MNKNDWMLLYKAQASPKGLVVYFNIFQSSMEYKKEFFVSREKALEDFKKSAYETVKGFVGDEMDEFGIQGIRLSKEDIKTALSEAKNYEDLEEYVRFKYENEEFKDDQMEYFGYDGESDAHDIPNTEDEWNKNVDFQKVAKLGDLSPVEKFFAWRRLELMRIIEKLVEKNKETKILEESLKELRDERSTILFKLQVQEDIPGVDLIDPKKAIYEDLKAATIHKNLKLALEENIRKEDEMISQLDEFKEKNFKSNQEILEIINNSKFKAEEIVLNKVTSTLEIDVTSLQKQSSSDVQVEDEEGER